MTWLDNIQPAYATVTGQYVVISHDSADANLTPDVQPLSGKIFLTPTVTAGRIEDVLAQIRPVTVRVFGGQIVDDEDAPGARILATDVDLGVQDWAWTATFEFDGGLKLRPVTFKAPAGTTVNLTSGVIPVSSAPYQLVQGEPGESAYQVARRLGYTGTEVEWLATLKGEKGDTPTWGDLPDRPEKFPPSAHTHDDRYYTEAEVDAKIDAAKPYDSGPRRFTPTGGIIDPANTGSIILRRIGDAVYCRIDGLMVTPGALDTWLWPNGIPAGFTIGEFGQVVDVTGGYTAQAGMNGAVRHRLSVYQNDLRYVGYLHGATTTVVEASRSDQTRRIYGWLPAWLTPDPIPTMPPGAPA